IDGDLTVSYAELEQNAHRTARALLASGVVPGDRVAVWCPNRWEFIVAFLGAQCIGASLVPLNTRYRGDEARAILERSRASALFVANGFLGNDYLGMLDGFDLSSLCAVVDVEGRAEGALSWEAFQARAEQTAPDALAAVMAS